MKRTESGEKFLEKVREILEINKGEVAISGESARCLWILANLPGQSMEMWTRFCRRFPQYVDVVETKIRLPAGKDDRAVALEFGAAMVATSIDVNLKLAGCIPLVAPAFVIAEIMTERDPLAVTRVAVLLRCLRQANQDVDLEEVRAILKAVRAGDQFEELQAVANVV